MSHIPGKAHSDPLLPSRFLIEEDPEGGGNEALGDQKRGMGVGRQNRPSSDMTMVSRGLEESALTVTDMHERPYRLKGLLLVKGIAP